MKYGSNGVFCCFLWYISLNLILQVEGQVNFYNWVGVF